MKPKIKQFRMHTYMMRNETPTQKARRIAVQYFVAGCCATLLIVALATFLF